MRALRAVKLVPFALAALGSGCGFRLEGAGALPPAMARTYLESEEPRSEFTARLADALRLRGTEIVTSPEQADAVLRITEDDTGQRVLSVTARNIPREYEVFYAITFTLSLEGERVLEPQSLVAVRSYTYDETRVLGKAAEEAELRRALAEDLARQVVRRIEALRPSTQSPGV